MKELLAKIRAFNQARDWEPFHTPKNLAMAVVVEAGELAERFQWLTPEESRTLDPTRKAQVAEEIADVLIHLVNLADKLGIDPIASAHAKVEKNALRYPVDRAKGNARKYDELD
jgi:NTP pyrophosphatase (non-canonical NTP hydrolase)